jgi:hypothetical protein
MPYVNYPMQDLGAGIDQLSAENRVPEGYSEDLLNVDPTPEGYLRKRTGYSSTAGWLPLRIKNVEANAADDKLCFFLDTGVDVSSIDLSNLRSSPLVVHGLITGTGANGDFANNVETKYYSGFEVDVRYTFVSGTGSNTVEGSVHNLGEYLFVGAASSTSASNTSNSPFHGNELDVTISNDNVTVSYINGTSAFEGYIYLLSGASSPGQVYNATGTWTGSLTIPTATHQLTNSNIIATLYEGDGTEWSEVQADVSINNAGDVTFTTSTGFSSPYTQYLALLRAVSTQQTYTITVPAMSTVTVGIPSLTGAFLISNLYKDDGTTRTKGDPSNLSIDVDTGIASLTIYNGDSAASLFNFYWEYAALITNKICVSTPISSDYSSSNVTLTLWGIGHESIYSSNLEEGRPGWVTHIDTYRTEGEEKLVVGLGGNFFTPTTDGSYLLPSAFPSLRNRTGTGTVMAPAFGASQRTRGYASFVGDGEGYARASSIEWVSGTIVRYVLDTPSLVVSGTPISIAAELEDYLTVEQASFSVHNGFFKIVGVTYGTSTIEVLVSNSAVTSADYDEQDCGAQCGIFTDQLPLTFTNTFMPGDVFASDAILDGQPLSVIGGTSTRVVLTGVFESYAFPSSIRVAGGRTSALIPIRDSLDSPTTESFLKGDAVNYSAYDRLVQILHVNTSPSISITASVLDGTATIVLGSGSTTNLSIGQLVGLVGAGALTGTHAIADIVSLTSFTLLVDAPDGNYSGTLLGKTIEINEDMQWQDSANSLYEVSVPSRWFPIEAPSDNYNATPETYFRYYDSNSYIDQPYIRSVMSNDNMYFTNGADEVYKYDGTNTYRAGLPRWQPQLFMTADTTSTNKIIIYNTSTSDVTAFANNVFEVVLGQEAKFTEGQYVVVTEGSSTLGTVLVEDVYQDGTKGYVRISGAVGSIGTIGNVVLTVVARYRYYFRLNAVDANDNIVASAATGFDDYIINLTESAAVNMQLVGLPAWDTYDYARIEVEVYRTKVNTLAPFFKVVTLDVPFNTNDGYISFTDTESDDTLVTVDLLSSLYGGNDVGAGTSEPLRAKYLTVSDNRLVLANIKDYPKIVTTFRDVGTTTDADYSGKKILLKSNSTDTLLTTNNTSRINFEWRINGSIAAAVTGTGPTYTVTASGTYTVGDWVYLFQSGTTNKNLNHAGWFQVTVGGTGSFGIVAAAGLSLTGGVDRLVRATDPKDVPVWLEEDYNYGTVNGNALSGTSLNFTALRRLVAAINVTQRVCQTEGFVPWIIAGGGTEFGGDTFVLSRPRSDDAFFSLTLPSTSIAGIDFYVNDLLRAANSTVAARAQLFSSRVVVSYQNFPELFNRPTGSSLDSIQTFDVNPADGQAITGVIPFFGDSAFGGATKDGIVVVFKTNSIYLLDLGGTILNDTRIQKIDSRGIGCTAPYSIAPTQNGIMFATSSGLYRLDHNLQVSYLGKKLERLWQRGVNVSALNDATGHYYPIENLYKMSYAPTGQDGIVRNEGVFAYNTVREYTADGYRTGSWTRYDSHPATGWANTSDSAFFGTSAGDVMYVAKSTDEAPYRDNGAPIAAEATLRSLDFGEPTIRKAVGHVMIDYRTEGKELDTSNRLLSSIDNKNQFEEADAVDVSRYDTPNDDLGSTGVVKVRTVKFSIGRRKGVYFQLKLVNDGLDSPMEIAGVSVRVSGLSDRGMVQAKNTTSE